LNIRTHAKKITVDSEEQTLTILWADDHLSIYSLEGLRRSCPCVECAGGHDKMGQPADPVVFRLPATRRWKIVDLQEVGNYAMQIFWDDGHNTGLYRWEYLRDLCPIEYDQLKGGQQNKGGHGPI